MHCQDSLAVHFFGKPIMAYKKKKRGAKETLSESLRSWDPNANWLIYTIDDQVAVDFVGRYEALADDLGRVCQRLNIPFDGWLPRAKGTARSDQRHYSELLSAEDAAYIQQRCAREIALFSYHY